MFGSVANLVTFFRLLMIPSYLFFFLAYDGQFRIVGFFLFVLAISTDWLDGFIARRTKITDFGVFMDPLVDRLLIGSIIILVFLRREIPLWSIALVLGRDLIIIAGHVFLSFFYGLRLNVSLLGKISTVAIMISMIMLIFGATFPGTLTEIGRWVFFVALGLSLVSGLQYVKMGINAFAKRFESLEGVVK